MRKFKLIKKLPFEGSPDIGYISTERLGEEGAHYWNHNWFHPEDYPEYWQEVKEEFPKIISFKNKNRNTWFSLKSNGKFAYVSDDGFRDKEELLKDTNFEIYEVAVAETEVYKLGDLVNNPKLQRPMPFIITKFYFDCNNEHILCNGECCGNGHVSVMKVEHYTKPEVLFVTEDKIEIFEGDSYYFIVENDKDIIPTAWTIQAHEAAVNCKRFCPLGKVQFSGYKAAEKYINENKPIYSKKQIRNWCLNPVKYTIHEFDLYVSRNEILEKIKR